MLILADTHVHIYPCHDFARAFDSIVARMDEHAADRNHVKVACLAERGDCHWFRAAAAGETAMPRGYDVERGAAGDESLTVTLDGKELIVVAGRQIRTAEGLEVLALTSDIAVPDGLPVRETVGAVLDKNAVPVLSWAMGKWTFGRGRIVKNLVENAVPGKLLAGDSSLRPACNEDQQLMCLARERDIAVVAGSDPLPVAGEERYCGSYFSVLSGEFDCDRPAAAIRRLLSAPESVIGSGGVRSSLSTALERMARYYLAGSR